MPRYRTYTDEAFIQAYEKALTMQDVCDELRCTQVTARAYATRLGLSTNLKKVSPKERPTEDIVAFQSIKGPGSMAFLRRMSPFANEDPVKFNRRLRRAIDWLFDPQHMELEHFPPELALKPPHGRNKLVKVINAVWDDPGLMNKEPIFISEQTGMHESEFLDYLEACWRQIHPSIPPDSAPESSALAQVNLNAPDIQAKIERMAVQEAKKAGVLHMTDEMLVAKERRRIYRKH